MRHVGPSPVDVCAGHAEVTMHTETPTSLLSTWPLPRANSAGPRRCVSRQQNYK